MASKGRFYRGRTDIIKSMEKNKQKGIDLMSMSSVTICSIVRDCNKCLIKNIPVIEKIRSCFKSSKVIIIENDSVDGTKQTLAKWKTDSHNVHIHSNDYNHETIPAKWTSAVNKFYSNYRISKMAEYRNQYLYLLNNEEFKTDFVIVVDLDVARLDIDGIIHSFSISDIWDVICSNGVSYSPALKKRYYDTYALVEMGQENKAQTVNSIQTNRKIWSFLKPGLPLIPVYSAYGGLAIYRFEAIKGKKYTAIKNEDDEVEVKCEHFSLCHEIRKAGFSRIYINPDMNLKYQRISLKIILGYLTRIIKYQMN